MEPKILINEQTVEQERKADKTGFTVAIVVLSLAALLVIFLVPGPGFFLALAIGVVIFLIARREKRRGGLKAYFVRRPVTDKFETSETDEYNESHPVYYLAFGDRSFRVNDNTFTAANKGDMYFVMYDAYDNHIVGIYDVNRYDLAPTLDIRVLG